jgi:hypothetical protein
MQPEIDVGVEAHSEIVMGGATALLASPFVTELCPASHKQYRDNQVIVTIKVLEAAGMLSQTLPGDH